MSSTAAKSLLAPISDHITAECAAITPLQIVISGSLTEAGTWFRGTVLPTGRTVVNVNGRRTAYVLAEYTVNVLEVLAGTPIAAAQRHLTAYTIGGDHGRDSTSTSPQLGLATGLDGGAFGELRPTEDVNGGFELNTLPATATVIEMTDVGCWSRDVPLSRPVSAAHPLTPVHRRPFLLRHDGKTNADTLRARAITLKALRATLAARPRAR